MDSSSWNILWSYLLPLIFKLPPFIARRIYPVSKLEKDIEIDIKSRNPIKFNLSSSNIPVADLYFRITNKSPIDVLLDRFIVDVWIQQPLCNGYNLDRRIIKSKETTDTHIKIYLNQIQTNRIKEKIIDSTAAITVKAYFLTKIGDLKVPKSIENIPLNN